MLKIPVKLTVTSAIRQTEEKNYIRNSLPLFHISCIYIPYNIFHISCIYIPYNILSKHSEAIVGCADHGYRTMSMPQYIWSMTVV